MPVSGGWAALPSTLLDQVLALLGLDDLRSCALVCRSWWRRLADEQARVWRVHCCSRLSSDALRAEVLAVVPGYRAKLKALLHGWNPQDCSRNMYVKLDGFTVHRNPVAQSTDGARGRRGFICGRHAWQVVWEGPLGTVAVVGVATRAASLQCHGYLPLLGADSGSWGWNLVDNKLLHDGHTLGNYPPLNNAPKYQVGEKIRVVLDCDGRTLSFERDCEFLGVAFKDLPKDEPVFPAISAVYGHTEVSMVYVGAPLDG